MALDPRVQLAERYGGLFARFDADWNNRGLGVTVQSRICTVVQCPLFDGTQSSDWAQLHIVDRLQRKLSYLLVWQTFCLKQKDLWSQLLQRQTGRILELERAGPSTAAQIQDLEVPLRTYCATEIRICMHFIGQISEQVRLVQEDLFDLIAEQA